MKGPRPRRKDDENDGKSEGADGTDGMTDLCNHASSSRVDGSDTGPVGALAWLRNVRVQSSPSSSGCFQFCTSRRRSFNDDSREFREAHATAMHENARRAAPGQNGNKALHGSYHDTDMDASGGCCDGDVRKQLWPVERVDDISLHEITSEQPGRSPPPSYGDAKRGNSRNAVTTTSSVPQSAGSRDSGLPQNGVYKSGVKQQNGVKSTSAKPSKSRHGNQIDLNVSSNQPAIPKRVIPQKKTEPVESPWTKPVPDIHVVNTVHEVRHVDSETDDELEEPSEHDQLLIADERQGFVAPVAGMDTSISEEDDIYDESFIPVSPAGRAVTLPNRMRPPPVVMLKSRSLEQAESYESDDSIGNAASLHSQYSARSKMSRLSKLSKLSVSTGPTIKIDPQEAVSPIIGLGLRRPINMGFATYSSIDSEDPQSSASCGSDLSPRSLPPEAHNIGYPSTRSKQGAADHTGDKAAKNVAMDSLKAKGKKSDVDSGRGSFPNSLNSPTGKPSSLEKPKTTGNSGIPRKERNSGDSSRTVEGGHEQLNTEERPVNDVNRVNYPELKTKRASLKKQRGRDMDVV